ncbi:sensor histidine kinase [Kibdelosporangium aridum]|uniref:histidine kinase n=2 Tax=Kibdelosporangium aridum TaxID=2030 RepID=A0A1W2FYC5_KIBAR|nr:ATP-binding protein [Kibdelosporangium aridum]SMD26957.1 Signal transduction histidine kinase [Kibdelosporangium aridum]
MTSRKWRLSTRLRVALTAAAGSAVVLVVGTAWFIGQLQDEADAKVFEIAQQKAHAVAVTLETANDVPGRLPELGSLGPWEVVDKDTGRRVASFPPACTAHPDVPFLAMLAKESPPYRVTLPQTAPGDIAANCYTAGTYPLDRDLQVAQVTINDSEYTVYAGERLDAGTHEPVATARATAWTTVPIGVVLIAVVAWLSVRRALRPVNAIRFEVADITSEGLRRRVPVPRTGDELSLLAETMNDMLTRLDRSTQRQRQFVADSSHELRGPLATLRTRLEVLLTYPDRMNWQEVCTKSMSDVERLQSLVSDLMLLARLEDKHANTRQLVDLSALVADEAADRPVITDVRSSVTVQGNPTHLRRMLRNLLDNAERHAASRTTVTLAVSTGQAVLTVTDDGAGIPEPDRERVFDRFVRLDEARTRDRGGSGLGLAIAREIAREHGGTLKIAPSDVGAVLVATIPQAGQ